MAAPRRLTRVGDDRVEACGTHSGTRAAEALRLAELGRDVAGEDRTDAEGTTHEAIEAIGRCASVVGQLLDLRCPSVVTGGVLSCVAREVLTRIRRSLSYKANIFRIITPTLTSIREKGAPLIKNDAPLLERRSF